MRGHGTEHIPDRGPYVLAFNHVSMLDWAFLSYYLRRPLRLTVDRDYYDLRLLRAAMRITGAIPVHTARTDLSVLRMAQAALARGEPLMFSPEGRISRSGRVGMARPGIIALASAARVPILPAALCGAYDAFPRHRRLPRPRPVSVVFGELLPPPPLGRRAMQRQLAERLLAHIAQLPSARLLSPPW